MHTIGVLLLAAATAGDGFGYGKPGVGLKKLFRPHVVATVRPRRAARSPATGAGCQFGHPGCAGGQAAPAAAGRGRRPGRTAGGSPTSGARSTSSTPTG